MINANKNVSTNQNNATTTPDVNPLGIAETMTPTHLLTLNLYPKGWLSENFPESMLSNPVSTKTDFGRAITDYWSSINALQLPITGDNDNWRVVKIDVYINMVFCYVSIGDGYDPGGGTDAATAYMEYIVNEILPEIDPIPDFMWTMIPWDSLGQVIDPSEQTVKKIVGASGGGAM